MCTQFFVYLIMYKNKENRRADNLRKNYDSIHYACEERKKPRFGGIKRLNPKFRNHKIFSEKAKSKF